MMRDDRGSVVAEFAVALPAVALVLLLGVGTLSAAGRHVRLQDASADAARLVARGESDDRARQAVTAAVSDSVTTIHARGDLVCVSASAPALLALRVSAESCALAGGF